MPNLENLKKQAKQYLRWHREGYFPVAAEIRATLPGFQHLDDRQVMEATFRLGDAQELVARQAGFPGWQALKAGTTAMGNSGTPNAPSVTLGGVEAHLYVTDFRRSCDFFVAKLGFSVAFVYGEPPYYGMVQRDSARLCMRLVCEPVFVGDIRQRESLLSASFPLETTAALKQLYVEFRSKDVLFRQPLRKEPWGAKTFIVEDPDGNLLLFAGPAG